MKGFDVIVIGSGIGGLVSAGILTCGGLKTLMLERQSNSGGYLSSFKRKEFLFDSAVDCIAGVAPGGLIHRVLELLGVENEIRFIRVDPIRISMFPDLEITVDADVKAYMERLMTLFPSEAGRIRNFFDKACSVYTGLQAALGSVISGRFELKGITADALRLMENSYSTLLDEYFRDHRLKAVLSDRCPFIGLAPSKVSAVAMINMIMSYFTLGAYRPAGGFQRLADAFVSGIREKGGQVIFSKGVNSILMDDGNCSGVRCDDGEEYTARHIISNADFGHTFSSLIGGRYASLAEEMMRSPCISTSFFIVYAGVQGAVGSHSSIGHFPSYDMESFFNGDMAFREDSTIGITAASIEDLSRAPAGCSTVVLHEMVEPSCKCLDKTACVEKILRKADIVIPGISDRIVLLDAATPETLQRYTGNCGGAAFGWRLIPGFRGGQWHGIRNLHIAGHWGDMGGGVLAAAYSGAKAAGAILEKEGIKSVV